MNQITLEEALPIVRDLEQKLIPLGAHCALGGSVLHRGVSTKDVDIFVYPHNCTTPRNPEELIGILSSIFPNGHEATDGDYPHDRLRFVVIQQIPEGFRKLEFFVFLTVPPDAK
jgi:hypothetical protein